MNVTGSCVPLRALWRSPQGRPIHVARTGARPRCEPENEFPDEKRGIPNTDERSILNPRVDSAPSGTASIVFTRWFDFSG